MCLKKWNRGSPAGDAPSPARLSEPQPICVPYVNQSIERRIPCPRRMIEPEVLRSQGNFGLNHHRTLWPELGGAGIPCFGSSSNPIPAIADGGRFRYQPGKAKAAAETGKPGGAGARGSETNAHPAAIVLTAGWGPQTAGGSCLDGGQTGLWPGTASLLSLAGPA
jgi:hypothetical protein